MKGGKNEICWAVSNPLDYLHCKMATLLYSALHCSEKGALLHCTQQVHIFTIVLFTSACTLQSTCNLQCKAGCCIGQHSALFSIVEGNSMPGIAAWWCKGAWQKAPALAKIPDSTGAGPCEGASDDPEKDHHQAGQLITLHRGTSIS